MARRIESDAVYAGGGQPGLDDEIVAAALDLIKETKAEVIILMGAVLAGRSLALERRLPVPILDGGRCAVPLLEALVRIGASAPCIGSYAIPSPRESIGLSANLQSTLLTSHRSLLHDEA